MAIPPVVRVDLFGGFRVLAAGDRLSRLPSPRQQELLALLVLRARTAPIPRQRCAATLWPESTDAQALTNLRRELFQLREGWPDLGRLVATGTRTLWWREDANATVDLVDFSTAAADGLAGDRAALREAARLYAGDLLPDSHADWLEDDREQCRQRIQQVLWRLIEVLEREGDVDAAVESAQRLTRLAPLDERGWCALMRCQAQRGARAAALHAYHSCAALLKEELGVAPGAAMRRTYQEILTLDAGAPVVGPASQRPSTYPLVGREAEWQALLRAWCSTQSRGPGLALIRGHSGIGKSRLAEELVHWCDGRDIRALVARCYAGEGRLAYAPIATWLKGDALQSTLARLDVSALTDIARLRPEVAGFHPGVGVPDQQLERWQRVRFFESLAQAFRSAAPVVLVLDDLQWTDTDTLEWLQFFLRSGSPARCLVVATVRTEEEPDNPQVGHLLGRLDSQEALDVIALGPLDQAGTAQLISAVADQTLDDEAVAQAYLDTEGYPLFIVERARMDLEGGARTAGPAGASRVQALVSDRLALLSDEARTVAGVAAVIGRDFPFDILTAASDLDEEALARALDELWRRCIVRARTGENWDFSHDRIREVTYGAIPPARARLLHRRVARALQASCGDRLDEVSASIAVHLDRGGQQALAVPFLVRAAAVATRVSAHEEAIRCLTYALTLLDRLPGGRDRDDQELALRSSLSVALNATRGYAAPEIEENLDRIFRLLRADGRPPVPARWLWVDFSLRFVLGDITRARVAAEAVLARSVDDPSCRCEAHHAMAATLLSAGDLQASRRHFEAALAAYDDQRPQRTALGSDLGVFARAWFAQARWLLGDDRAAVALADDAIGLAQRLEHPFSQALAWAYAALLHQMRRDVTRVTECANSAWVLCDRYSFTYYGDWAQVLLGWATGQAQPAEGIAIIETAIARLDRSRSRARRPYYLSLLAETHVRAGNRERAGSVLTVATDMAVDLADVWWLPALYLQQSELQAPHERAATRQQALALARRQGSRALERRILES